PEVVRPQPVPAEAPAVAEDELARCRSGTVLVVEDEDGVRDLARRVLEQQGHRVLEARNGPEALNTLDQAGDDLDLIVSDVIVPDADTSYLDREARRRRPDLPILYMSGYSREEMLERGLIPQGRAFLQKPFTAEELGIQVCRQIEAAGAATGTGAPGEGILPR
ncbi:MAG TPA: response regulator, partial [Gemmatimonadales bacterium]